MSPKVTEVWGCRTWDEAAHYLKLIYAEGEIDFIVSGPLSGLGTDTFEIKLTDLPPARKVSIEVEHPAEIALKKMHYRPTMLKPRDIFDIAVANSLDHDALVGNLSVISDKKNALIKRLDNVDRKFLQAELAELDIQAGWDDQKRTAWTRRALCSNRFRERLPGVVSALAECSLMPSNASFRLTKSFQPGGCQPICG